MTQFLGTELSKKMAVVFTERLRTELMTCEEVVATGRYPYTGHFGILSKKDKEKVAEAMALVRVEKIKDLDFTKISDGQRQRVMLARAICQEPQILILDEPTSFLDMKYKLEFLSVLQRLKRQKGLTVIMSLHELELAKRVSDRLLCIGEKKVEGFGTPEEIFQKGRLASLFSIECGSFDEENATPELEAYKEAPKVFVIAGGGTGRNVYRRLQRQGISFIAGILFENDVEYPVARVLAAEVIKTEAFEEIKEAALVEAKKKLKDCEKVILCKEVFGSFEKANEVLFAYAKELGIKIEKEYLRWQR
jgi:iron complex transport system ATP-binding protein